jgi:hypothetical protein
MKDAGCVKDTGGAMCTRMEWYLYSHIGDSFCDPPNCDVLRYVSSALYKLYEKCYDRCRVGDGVLWSALKVASISCRIEWVNQCHKSPRGATIKVDAEYLCSWCVSDVCYKQIAGSLALAGLQYNCSFRVTCAVLDSSLCRLLWYVICTTSDPQ